MFLISPYVPKFGSPQIKTMFPSGKFIILLALVQNDRLPFCFRAGERVIGTYGKLLQFDYQDNDIDLSYYTDFNNNIKNGTFKRKKTQTIENAKVDINFDINYYDLAELRKIFVDYFKLLDEIPTNNFDINLKWGVIKVKNNSKMQNIDMHQMEIEDDHDIREDVEVTGPRYVERGRAQITRPPRPFSLYYMVFINGSGQMGLKDPDIQKIIGRIAQIVNDNNSVYPNELQSWLDTQEPPIVLSQAKISLEEKVRVWQAINKPYQISLFYRAAPVYLSSGEIITTPRVSDASFELGITGEERG